MADTTRFDRVTLRSGIANASITGSMRTRDTGTKEAHEEETDVDLKIEVDADAARLADTFRSLLGEGYEDMAGEGRVKGQFVLVGPTGDDGRDLRIDGDLAWRRFASGGISSEDGTVTLRRPAPGTPLLATAKSKVNGGTVDVRATCDLGKGKSPWTAKAKVVGLDTSPMVTGKGASRYLPLLLPAIVPAGSTTPVLSGRLDADLDLRSDALREPGLSDTLSGPGSIKMTQGSVSDSTLFSALSGQAGGGSLGMLAKAVPALGGGLAQLGKSVMFSELSSSFRLGKRMISLDPVVLVSPSVTLRFGGVVGFDGTMDLAIPLVLGGDVGAQVGKVLPNRTIPLRVRGKTGALSVTPDLKMESIGKGLLEGAGKGLLPGGDGKGKGLLDGLEGLLPGGKEEGRSRRDRGRRRPVGDRAVGRDLPAASSASRAILTAPAPSARRSPARCVCVSCVCSAIRTSAARGPRMGSERPVDVLLERPGPRRATRPRTARTAGGMGGTDPSTIHRNQRLSASATARAFSGVGKRPATSITGEEGSGTMHPILRRRGPPTPDTRRRGPRGAPPPAGARARTPTPWRPSSPRRPRGARTAPRRAARRAAEGPAGVAAPAGPRRARSGAPCRARRAQHAGVASDAGAAGDDARQLVGLVEAAPPQARAGRAARGRGDRRDDRPRHGVGQETAQRDGGRRAPVELEREDEVAGDVAVAQRSDDAVEVEGLVPTARRTGSPPRSSPASRPQRGHGATMIGSASAQRRTEPGQRAVPRGVLAHEAPRGPEDVEMPRSRSALERRSEGRQRVDQRGARPSRASDPSR